MTVHQPRLCLTCGHCLLIDGEAHCTNEWMMLRFGDPVTHYPPLAAVVRAAHHHTGCGEAGQHWEAAE